MRTHLACGIEAAIPLFCDEQRFKPAFTKFLKSCDGKLANLEHLRLQPVATLPATVRPLQPLRYDSFATYLAHLLEQLLATADDVVEIKNPIAADFIDAPAQDRFPLLNGATA